MRGRKGYGWLKGHARRWRPVPVLAGLVLVMAVFIVSASTRAPEEVDLRWKQMSALDRFAAYPDIGVGAGGLVAVVWTQGDNIDDKHNGPLKLRWVDDSSGEWSAPVTVDGSLDDKVYDAAIAISGSTIHLVWSRPRNTVRYTTCSAPNYSDCAPPQLVAITGEEALQVDIVVDDGGMPHVVWVEAQYDGGVKKHRVYHSRKTGAFWSAKRLIIRDLDDAIMTDDSQGPAIAYANNLIHVVWVEWNNIEHTDSQLNYCRRSVTANDWSLCVTPLASWDGADYLARNASIAADQDGNVYVVWDMVSQDDTGFKRQYAIGYKHATNNGDSWRRTHTYPDGSEFGDAVTGATIFRSGEGQDYWVEEYGHYLRPQVSLALSGTVQVPVLAWHAEVPSGEVEEGSAQSALQIPPHKVYWAYATQPGSYSSGQTGYMYWATEYLIASTDLCGEVDMSVNSGTGRLAAVGDLREVLNGESLGNHLHIVYHEETGGEFWGVFYNNNGRHQCYKVNLPLVLRNAGGGGE